MHHYPHHIGDFDRATRHLTRVERSIYRDLLDVYYDTEKPLSLDAAMLSRRVLARSNEESTAVEQVLNEFFTKTPLGWYHDRCEEEIENYKASNTQKSVAGKASAAKRALKKQQALNALPTAVEQPLNSRSTAVQRTCNGTPTNQEPRTKNQEPVNPVAQPSLSIERAGAATPVDLSIALRKEGVNCQPADPRLIAMSEQGISVATAIAACHEAKISLNGQAVIALGYVAKILKRWSDEGDAMRVSGAPTPRRPSPGGFESAKDLARRTTIEALTGETSNERAHDIIDINARPVA